MSILDRVLRRKADFTASEQLFTAVDDLIAQLRAEGKSEVADELVRGWGTRNLTGGWALFLDAIDNVEARRVDGPDSGEQALLRKIPAAVRRMVFRQR